MTIAEYYVGLSSLGQELDYYQKFQVDRSEDRSKFQKLEEKEQVYNFLAGLNMEDDQIRIQVLDRDHFPSLKQNIC